MTRDRLAALTHLPALAIAAAAGIASAACDGSSRWGGVRDSAGIRIVESVEPLLDSTRAWRISERPSVVIGDDSSVAAQQFADIGGALVLGGGRIVVVNGRPPELRLFDSTGRHIRTIGRRGEGPGEFARPREVIRYRGDSIAVHDRFGFKVSVFDSSGAFGRSALAPRTRSTPALRHSSDIPTLIGAVASGDLTFAFPDRFAEGNAEIIVGDLLLVRSTADGQRSDTIAAVPGIENVVAPGSGPVRRKPYLFTGFARAASTDSILLVTTPRQNTVTAYRLSGSPVLIARDLRPARPVDRDLMARYARFLRGSVRPDMDNPDPEVTIRRLVEETPTPDSIAGFTDIRIDATGHVWVRHVGVPGVDTTDARYSIFDQRGALLTDVRVPAQFYIADVGAAYVLGVHHDSLGVQSIRRYALQKPPD